MCVKQDHLPFSKALHLICVTFTFHEREYVGPEVITDKVTGLLSTPTSMYTGNGGNKMELSYQFVQTVIFYKLSVDTIYEVFFKLL